MKPERKLLMAGLAVCAVVLLLTPAAAQQTQAPSQQEQAQSPGQEEVLEPAVIEPGFDDQQEDDFLVGESSQDSTGGEAEAEVGQGSGRFIPSEEISQDLGVSFPVDI